MPRKRPETRLNKIFKMLIEEYQPRSAQELQNALKDPLGDAMENCLKLNLTNIWIMNMVKHHYHLIQEMVQVKRQLNHPIVKNFEFLGQE